MGSVRPHPRGGRWAAFTLTEVMVVLALTGMVVAIAFYVWYNFESFGAGYREQTRQVNEWNALHHALRLDASRSVRLSQQAAAVQCWQEDSLPGPRWEALPNALVRTLGTQVDSFKVADCRLYAFHRFDAWLMLLVPQDSLLPDTLHYPLPDLASARLSPDPPTP